MNRVLAGLLVAAVMQLGAAGRAAADDNAEMYLERAEDILHHSCASLVEESSGDENQIEMVVRLMVAVSVYNRDIDINELAPSDDSKAALHAEFISAVQKGCEEDADALLAGVVDRAVVQALTAE